MVELTHRQTEPVELTLFRANHPNLSPAHFDSRDFEPTKWVVKAALNEDQGGLCVYCECQLGQREGQVEHIKPKGGSHAHPHLTFTYTNLAHSCNALKHCGNKKHEGLLPIEPAIGCNEFFSLHSDGSIEAASGLTRQDRLNAEKTRDMLALNHPDIKRERERWILVLYEIAIIDDSPIDHFLEDKPFRFILKRQFPAQGNVPGSKI